MTRTKVTATPGSVKHGRANWVLRQGSPEITLGKDEITATIKYAVEQADLVDIPTAGSVFPIESLRAVIPGLAYAHLDGAKVTPLSSGDVFELELSYTTGDDFSNSEDEVEYTPELTGEDVELPLETLSGYLAKWDHALWCNVGSAPVPSGYNTTKVPIWDAAPDEDPGPDTKVYRMCKDGEKPDCKYMVMIRPCTKPGVTGYLRGKFAVTYTLRSKNRAKVIRNLSSFYAVNTPPDTFGLTGQWLKVSPQIVKNGKIWEGAQSWILAPVGWDGDLYSGGTNAP